MTQIQKLSFGTDTRSQNAFAPIPPTSMVSATLVNATPATITVPQGFNWYTVTFVRQDGTSIFVDVTGATAADPVGATFAATTSMQNPGAITISSTFSNGNQRTISVVTTSASSDVTVSFFGSGTNAI